MLRRAHGPVRLGDAAALAGMTPEAFCRYFKRVSGRTFVNEVRVGRACRLLIESAMPITDIAYTVGFGSVANFNRQFRRMKGVTPRAYRALHRGRDHRARGPGRR